MNEAYLPKTAAEYITCFRQLAAIIDKAIDHIENNPPTDSKALARIEEAVETIACLRGDAGAYADSRPEGLTEYQKEMYATENFLRDRLLGLGYKYTAR